MASRLGALVSLLPRMAPVRVGDHTQELIAVLSAEHCDGLSTDSRQQLHTGRR